MRRAGQSRIKNQEPKIESLMPLLLDWFSRHARDLPWRRTRDPYAIWVSEIMLQQTQVKTVQPYWTRWMRELPTIQSLAKASPDKTHKLWEGLGYYARVRNLQQAARIIVEKHAGRFPERFDEILALPGVGRYTAGAICSIAFNQPAPVLDGNVIRVLTRVFGIADDPRGMTTKDRLWHLAEQLVTQASRLPHPVSSIQHPVSALNQSLMELGALICTPQRPDCDRCPIARSCVARHERRVGELPNLGRRRPPTRRRFAAFVVQRQSRFLVRQRPPGVVNAHLWEFPNVELNGDRTNLRTAARKFLGVTPQQLTPLCTITHSITRYRITLEAFLVGSSAGRRPRLGAPVSDPAPSLGADRIAPGRRPALPEGRWLRLSELKRLSFPSAHRKILSRLSATSCALK
jgi:A/G-specific adenine glycosylase